MALPVIAIINASTVLDDAAVQRVIPALQKQVSIDLNAYWNKDATLAFWPKNQVVPEGWQQIIILDNSDQAGALGYHDLSPSGMPLGKVFAKTDLDAGLSWTATLSHETNEQICDSYCNLAAQGPDGNFWAVEVCDPVESDSLGYLIDGILVSDFVLPGWFGPASSPWVDFKQRISKPLEIAAGGYMSVFTNGAWKQSNADSIPIGSRRYRRTLPRDQWKRSRAES